MLRKFLQWWVEQLAGLVPRNLRWFGSSARETLLVTPVRALATSDEVVIEHRRNGRETLVGRFRLDGSVPQELSPLANTPATLRVGKADVLSKMLSLPIAARGDLKQALGFEMDRETPFSAGELYWTYRIEGIDREQKRLAVRLLLTPKAAAAEFLRAFCHIGIVPTHAEVADGADAGSVLPLVEDSYLKNPRSPMLKLAVGACVALSSAAIVTPFVRQSIALTEYDNRIAVLRTAVAQAQKVRREIEQISASADLIQDERRKFGIPLEIIAAVTRTLPDDTYLAELSLRQRKLTLNGRSSAAAKLIERLTDASGFRNVSFAAPVTRLNDLHVDFFTIAMEVP